MSRASLGGLLVAAVAVAGCGSGAGHAASSSTHRAATTSTASRTTAERSAGAARRAPRRRRRRPAGPPIGRTQLVHAGSSTLAVTVTRLIDPLTDTGTRALPGTRAVGVQLTIVNRAGATYDSTASGDVSVALSAGAPAPLFVKAGACATPLTDFESLIGVGQTRSGCVAFSVPRRARVVAVRFSPHARAAGTVSWR